MLLNKSVTEDTVKYFSRMSRASYTFHKYLFYSKWNSTRLTGWGIITIQ